MKLLDEVKRLDMEACGCEENRKISADFPFPFGGGGKAKKLAPDDEDHPNQSMPAQHKAAMKAGFSYKGTRDNGSTMTHVYSHKGGLSDHSETCAKPGMM